MSSNPWVCFLPQVFLIVEFDESTVFAVKGDDFVAKHVTELHKSNCSITRQIVSAHHFVAALGAFLTLCQRFFNSVKYSVVFPNLKANLHTWLSKQLLRAQVQQNYGRLSRVVSHQLSAVPFCLWYEYGAIREKSH